MFRHLRQVVAVHQFTLLSNLSKWNDNKAKLQARTDFLLRCKQTKVYPKSLEVKPPFPSLRLTNATRTYQTAILTASIRNNFVLIRQVNHNMTQADITFLTDTDATQFRGFLHSRFQRIFQIHHDRLHLKLQSLLAPHALPFRKPVNNPIVNLTTTVIPPAVTKILELGTKFNLNLKPVPLIDIVAPLEAQLNRHPDYDDATRQGIARLLTTTYQHYL